MHKKYILLIFSFFLIFFTHISGVDAEEIKWTRVKDIPFYVGNVSTVELSNGKILVVGNGEREVDTELEELPGSEEQIYNPQNNTWEISKSLVDFGHSNTVTKLVDGRVLIVGYAGNDDLTLQPISGEIYDPRLNLWTLTNTAIVPIRLYHTATRLENGKVLIAGGYNKTADGDHAYISELFNPVTNTWEETGTLNKGRNLHTATLLKNGNVLVTGGRESVDFSFNSLDGGTNSVEIYNGSNGTWSIANHMYEARNGHTATLLPNGKVLITGGGNVVNGMDIEQILDTAEIFDPLTGQWTTTGSMNSKRIWHTAELLSNGKVMVFGGSNGERDSAGYRKGYNTAEVYDPATGVWTQIPTPMNSGHVFHSSIKLASGNIFITGGLFQYDEEGNYIPNVTEIFSNGEVLGDNTGPEPFLELPWRHDGMSFNEAALSINSFFDHTYPTLSRGSSIPETTVTSNLSNSFNPLNQVTTFNNQQSPYYSSHDGYDYGRTAKANNNAPMLAAAGGRATFVSTCGACGNAVHIDHGNYYQSRYYHLNSVETFIRNSNTPVQVNSGQQIGTIGYSGNVRPQGEGGAHIHFMVVQDKNRDGNFEDNIPDGLVDPFGWMPLEEKSLKALDPWEHASFSYAGQQRTGNTSYYLWKKQLDGMKSELPVQGGDFQSGKANVTVPENTFNKPHTITIKSAPNAKASENVESLGSIIEVIIKDPFGALVTILTTKLTIAIDFSETDLSRYKLGSLAIYSSTDGINWQKEETLVDLLNKKATTKVDHLTYFALMGELADTDYPTTIAITSGSEGNNKWYRSDVIVTINGQDNQGGLGIDFTSYRINGNEWRTYTEPFVLSEEGKYSLEFYSADKAENVEAVKTVEFTIDKTAPEAEISYDISKFDVIVKGKDNSGNTTVRVDNTSRLNPKYIVSDNAGNILAINTSELQIGKQVTQTIKSLQYNGTHPVQLDRNFYFTLVLADRNNTIKQLDQYFSTSGDKRIFTKYLSSNDTTLVYTRAAGAQYTEEKKDGLILLNLFTENGKLKYRY